MSTRARSPALIQRCCCCSSQWVQELHLTGVFRGNNKLQFAFIYNKHMTDVRCDWLPCRDFFCLSRSQVIYFNFALRSTCPSLSAISSCSSWELLLEKDCTLSSLKKICIQDLTLTINMPCFCKTGCSVDVLLRVWCSAHITPSLSPLSSAIPVTPDSVIQWSRNTIKSWILEAYVKFSFSSHHRADAVLHPLHPPCKSLPPVSWKSYHPTVLTSINLSACNHVPVIYASGRAPCSRGKLCTDNHPQGMIIRKAHSQLI